MKAFTVFLVLFVINENTGVHGAPNVRVFSTDPQTGQQKRVYTIAHGHDWGAYEYIDDGGVVTGFMLDLIREVCQEAGISCQTVWEPYTNCVVSLAGQHMRGGQGLMDRWYDGCIGWAVSVARMSFFKFSASFLKASRASFYVKSGSSFNPSNWDQSTIGFMDGWVDDEKCLARLTSKVLTKERIKHYGTPADLKKAIIDGDVDAGHVEEGVLDSDKALQRVGDWRSCVVRGDALMTRVDSDLPAKFNEGFNKLVSSGRFGKLCKEAEKIHNADGKGIINCV